MKEPKYSLRYAAGAWWLLDIGQSGGEYRAPVQMNSLGADIIKLLAGGRTFEETAEQLCMDYEAENDSERRQIEADVAEFLRTLREQGIEITGEKGTVMI